MTQTKQIKYSMIALLALSVVNLVLLVSSFFGIIFTCRHPDDRAIVEVTIINSWHLQKQNNINMYANVFRIKWGLTGCV